MRGSRSILAWAVSFVLAAGACADEPSSGGADVAADVVEDVPTGGAIDAGDASDASHDGDAGSCQVGAPSGPLEVATDRGLVRGAAVEGARAWLGIPYAAPPVGDLRWRPPEDPACYDGAFEADAFGAVCPQREQGSNALIGDEDCLTLNVWAPEDPPDTPRPVMVFIHGGGNIQGSASQQVLGTLRLYDGRHLAAEQGVVVVTIEYRLGPFGFLALPELSARGKMGTSGNYALLDQLHALKWVQRNIAAFGGDPSRVLLFGESAGAVNTCSLLASPLSDGLFSAALMQSGGCNQPALAAQQAAHSGKLDQSDCGGAEDRLACLMAMDTAAVMEAFPGGIEAFGASLNTDLSESFGPVVDGWVLPKSPFDAIEAGEQQPVPFVIGSNAEELASLATFQVDTEAQYEQIVKATFGVLGVADDVLAAYPVGDYPSPQEAMVALYSDLRFSCPARRVARAAAASSSQPVYRYWFSQRAQTPQGQKAADHGTELLYVFGTLMDFALWTPEQADQSTSQAMMASWASLATSGSPDTSELPVWPPYDATDPSMELDATAEVLLDVRGEQCDAWDAILEAVVP